MSAIAKRNNMFPTWNNFFDDFFSKDAFDWGNKNFTSAGSTLPSVNVKETDNDFQIELAAPGMKKEDFKVELDKNLLTISAEHKEEKQEKNGEGRYSRREFNYESFSRSFTLPAEVVEREKIGASYKDGILNIVVPKKDTAKTQPVKNIAVN